MKLSIITVNLNNKVGLQKTIDSIISQTFKDFEWIVIDGGSTDGSKELIEKYSDYITYWVSEPDKGIYNAMNKGIKVAKGEYLQFLNSGDYLFNEMSLEESFKYCDGSDIMTGLVFRNSSFRLLRNYQSNIVRQLTLDTLSHQGTFINRRLFDNYMYREDYNIVSDWIAWIEWLLFKNCSFQQIDVNVAIQDMTGISNTQSKMLIEERHRAMVHFWGERMANELPRVYNDQNRMKSELSIPAINMLLYLYYKVPKAFSFLYRVISIFVKLVDYFRIENSYKFFLKNKNNK